MSDDAVGAWLLIALGALIGVPIWLWNSHPVWFWPAIVAELVVVGLMIRGFIRLVDRLAEEGRARAARQAVLDRHVQTTDQMTGTDFEELVARLLRRDGWSDVVVHGGAGDGGLDVSAMSSRGSHLVIQCKRYGQKIVAPREIRELSGTIQDFGADQGWFVTTSGFSAQARAAAERFNIRLIDRAALASWMAQEQGSAIQRPRHSCEP